MRRMMLFLCLLGPAFAMVPAQTAGRGNATGTPTGSITGHVYYADTNGPARLATVVLQAGGPESGSGTASLQTVTTLPDGSFALAHVAAGAYMVTAIAPGYVSPVAALGLSHEELLKPDKATQDRIAVGVPHVQVQANLNATVEVTLQRGAAVAGTVLYDDGSPAAGLQVNILTRSTNAKGEPGKWVKPAADLGSMQPYGQGAATTDDRGAYRLSGLAAGEYIVEADLSLQKTSIKISGGGTWSNSNGGTTVPVYSGNVLRQKDSVPFKIKLGEERTGEDLEIPLNKLHSVSGALVAIDGHTVNGGTATLVYADDKTKAASSQLTQADPTFQLNFVPEGDYLVRVSDAADLEYTEVPGAPGTFPPTRTETKTVHSYGAAEQPLHVGGDITGLAVTVPEKKKAQ